LARLYLTGGVRFDGPAGRFGDADLPGHQGRIALVALALERRPLARHELADIVWGHSVPTQWNGALSTVLSKIRTLFVRSGLDGTKLLPSTGGSYELVLPSACWVDLEDAYRRLDRAEGAVRHGDDREATVDATVASSTLRRSLLAGVDNEWVDQARRRQQDAAYRCLTVLAAAWHRLGDHQLAATIADTAIAIDPLREVGYRILAEAEIARGDRGAAAQALRRCERMLRDELQVAPSPETVRLADVLRSSH
jgi:SARP family transcriptional regulator, regulator of embCAB operon